MSSSSQATKSDASIGNHNTPSITITVDKLGKKFNREWIFRNLTYTFEPGNIYAITGPNGSGKSTLLQVLWGQMPPSTGLLKYSNRGTEIQPEGIFRHLAIATPYMDLIEEFTLLEQIRFHFKIKAARNAFTEDQVLDKMGLAHAHNKFISNFSSGMRQRVKLALAFFSQSGILFLDEPGTNLDAQAFDWYLQQLAEVPSNVLVLIASNQPSEYPSNAQKLDIMSLK